MPKVLYNIIKKKFTNQTDNTNMYITMIQLNIQYTTNTIVKLDKLRRIHSGL